MGLWLCGLGEYKGWVGVLSTFKTPTAGIGCLCFCALTMSIRISIGVYGWVSCCIVGGLSWAVGLNMVVGCFDGGLSRVVGWVFSSMLGRMVWEVVFLLTP